MAVRINGLPAIRQKRSIESSAITNVVRFRLCFCRVQAAASLSYLVQMVVPVPTQEYELQPDDSDLEQSGTAKLCDQAEEWNYEKDSVYISQ